MYKIVLIVIIQFEVSCVLIEWLVINDIDIQIVSSGIDVIEYIVLDWFDVVLVQLVMEGMSGLCLVYYFKVQEQLVDVLVILLCCDECEMDLVKGKWLVFFCVGLLYFVFIFELKCELVN